MAMTGRHKRQARWMRWSTMLALTLPLAAHAGDIEEVVVWSKAPRPQDGPVVSLTPADLAGATVVTTEDMVKYEPGLIVRRRFVGDANGTLGIRGANMFQTSRSMVFADGVPLHYLLQSRWDGAPRWSMMAASEVDRVDVLYGPYSAEYGGNAMGGVILMESRIPERRELRFEQTAFVQQFSAYGVSRDLPGYKSFLSASDRFGDTGVFLSWNRLGNQAQPQSYFQGAAAGKGPLRPVSGGIVGSNERGQSGVWFGDTGVTDSVTDNFKLKLAHDVGAWSTLLNVAYENRTTDLDAPDAYLHDADGNAVWSGNVVQDGTAFSLPANRLGVSNAARRSLSLGLRVKGWLGDDTALEGSVNWFGVLDDETRVSARNPADPAWTPAGQITRFGPTGWRTAEVKLQQTVPAIAGLSVVAGLSHEDYRLALDVFASDDYRAGSLDRYTARSGGQTALNAVFAQLRWNPSPQWELGVGLRQEYWQSSDGYYSDDRPATAAFDLVQLPSRREARLSPKFTLGWYPDGPWSLRYAAARAWRFPIVEELFSQYQAFNAVNSANPGLAPENGLHQSLSLARTIAGGELQLNVFHETVRDVIEAQATTLPGGIALRTFLPVSAVATRGAELVFNHNDLLVQGLDLRFNVAWTRSIIDHNLTAPALEGNVYPRMPAWRVNLLLDYRLQPGFDVGVGVRHASDSVGTLDNVDRIHGVYGAQDAYTFVNLKANWAPTEHLRFGLGIDNVFDQLAFVTHPWPGRTLFLEASVRL